MGRIWGQQNKFRQWLEVELAAAEALAETGEVPAEAARLLRQHASCDAARIGEVEREGIADDVLRDLFKKADALGTRYFYQPKSLRTRKEIRAGILAVRKEAEGVLDEILTG